MENLHSPDKEIELTMDKYLRKELSDAEKASFEQHLTQNPQLQNELALRRDIIIGIHAAENRTIRKRLETADRQNFQYSGTATLKYTLLAIIIISLTALLLIWLLK